MKGDVRVGPVDLLDRPLNDSEMVQIVSCVGMMSRCCRHPSQSQNSQHEKSDWRYHRRPSFHGADGTVRAPRIRNKNRVAILILAFLQILLHAFPFRNLEMALRATAENPRGLPGRAQDLGR